MTLTENIEVGEDCLTVEFFATPEWENSGIGAYEFWGFQGIDYGTDYAVLNDYPEWNHSQYLFWENWIIAIYVVENFKKLEEKFATLLREETIPDNY